MAEQNKFNFMTNTIFTRLAKDRKLKAAYDAYSFAQGSLIPSGTIRHISPIPKLFDFCIRKIAEIYKSGPFSESLTPTVQDYLGELLNDNLPLEKTISLESDNYWRRIFFLKNQDISQYFSHITDPNINGSWKYSAVEQQFRSIIETTSYEKWNEEFMDSLAKAAQPYIKKLQITKMMPIPLHSMARDQTLAKFKIYNYPLENCHHGNLDFLRYLTNLTMINLEFGPHDCGTSYDGRLFNFSYADIEGLSRGLAKLKALTSFTIRRSLLDKQKLDIIFRNLELHKIVSLELSYCQLKDDTAKSICKFLMNTPTLRKLDLKGNELAVEAMREFGRAFASWKGLLEFLCISRNPITDLGLVILLNELDLRKQVSHLNCIGIEITEQGSASLINFISEHTPIKEIYITAIPIGPILGIDLIEVLQGTYGLEKLECQACGLTVEQMYDIKILMERNRYFQENPILLHKPLTKEEDKRIMDILSEIRNPLLLKSISIFNEKAKCREYPNAFAEREETNELLNANNFNKEQILHHFEIANSTSKAFFPQCY